MLTFLSPLFLLGLLGISVPVILHLLHRRPQRVHDFPTLRFLLKKRIAADRQRNLKRLLILLMRTLALAALALAFAYPVLKKILPQQPAARVVLLDRSASMAAGDRWTKAKTLARAELLAASGGDRAVALVDFGRETHVANFETVSTKGANAALNTVAEPSDSATSPAAALRTAAMMLMDQPFSEREIVLISDFAGGAWTESDLRESLPKGITLRCLPLELPPVEGNLAILDLQAPRSIYGPSEAVSIKARVHNYSAGPRQVELRCIWEQLAEPQDFVRAPLEMTVDLPALASTDVEFNFLTHNDRPIRGRVTLETAAGATDPFPRDDLRYFTISANEPLRVARLASPIARDVFLKTAFAPFFEKENRRFAWRDIAWSDQSEPAPMNLNEPPIDLLLVDQGLDLSTAQAEKLATYVKQGGRLLLFLGEPGELRPWETALLGDAVKLGRERTPSTGLRVDSAPPRFARANLAHPLLAPFSEPGGGNIFATSLKHWREFELEPGRGETLISRDGSQPLVALLPLEQGHAMIWAFPPDRSWTDWPLQTTFLPFLYRFAELGSGEAGARAGGTSFLAGDPGIPAADGARGVQLGESGAGADRRVWAVNLDPAESELNPVISPDILPRLVSSEHALTTETAAPSTTLPDITQDPSSRWILWLLAGVLLFSLGELFLANRTAT